MEAETWERYTCMNHHHARMCTLSLPRLRIQLRMADMEMSQSTSHRHGPHKIRTEEMRGFRTYSQHHMQMWIGRGHNKPPIKISASGKTLL